MWQWLETVGLRRFSEMLFTGRPFTADELKVASFVNSVVPRDKLEAETAKYAHACSITRPTDVVVAQKTFIEAYRQYRGEYFGSLLTVWLEGMLPLMKDDGANDVNLGKDNTFKQGIGTVVKNHDLNYTPDWRLSMKGPQGLTKQSSPSPGGKGQTTSAGGGNARATRLTTGGCSVFSLRHAADDTVFSSCSKGGKIRPSHFHRRCVGCR
jgi:hypothetical protein